MSVLDELKKNIGVNGTAQDEDLGDIISRGEARLNGLAGVNLDFESQGLPRDLLLEFGRYAYNNVVEYFEQNFAAEILRMQLESAVKDLAENES